MGMLFDRKAVVYTQRGHTARHDAGVVEHVFVQKSLTDQVPEKIRTVLGELRFPAPPEERPYLYGCMVLSFDGKMGFPDDPEGTLISK